MLAYGPAWQAGFVWDDDVFVTNDPILIAPHALWKIWFSFESPSQYFPLTYTSFYFERAIWGLNPAGYHLVNILLHGLAAIVLWRVLKNLRAPGAWLGAAIFALHPVQVESVAWVAERKNVLMGVFFFLTLWAWIKFIDGRRERPALYYILALVFFASSLAAKTTACTLPAALFLILWLEKIPINGKRIGQIAPFIAMSAVMSIIAMRWEHAHTGIHQTALAVGLPQRILIASRAIWFYAGKLFWPFDLSANYPQWKISPGNPLAYVWLLMAAGAAGILWRARRRAGRAVETGILFFVLTLGPMLGLVMHALYVYTFVADHFQYIACIGLIAPAAAGLTIALNRMAPNFPFLRALVGLALLIGLGTLTWNRAAIYEDSQTLWQATLAQNPDSAVAHAGLGNVEYKNGEIDSAIAHFRKAIELNPNYIESYYNISTCLLRAGRAAEAINYCHDELKRFPDDAVGHKTLAEALDRQGDTANAIAEYRKAIQIDPDFAAAYGNLGVTLLKSGKPDDAIAELEKALALDPRIAGAEVFIGIACANKGQPAEAIGHFTKAVHDNPTDSEARSNLGMALAQNGQTREAIDQFQIILQMNPNQVEACNNLAWLLATASDKSLRDGPKAIQLAQHASGLTGGNNPIMLHTLASAYAETGDFEQALATGRKALELAVQQKNEILAAKIRKELKLYEKRSPARTGRLEAGPSEEKKV
jgi:tetratricopeptide (TPR) repeat protein